MTSSWDRTFIDYSCTKLRQLADRICDCLDKLSSEQIWFRGSENENAIGNLVLHLCGNVRQWIGFGVGGRPDVRQRDLEFSGRAVIEAGELKERLRRETGDAISIISELTPEGLIQTTKVQGYEMPVLQAVYHVVEHFSGHTGQIIFSTKHFTGRDLGFYSHLASAQPHWEKTP